MVYEFFDKKTGSRANVYDELIQESPKEVFKTFKRRKV